MQKTTNEFKELINISTLFTEKFFSIPDYQRGFSWETAQLEDFVGDIENLLHNSHTHYTGTIVLTPKLGTDNTYQIVDGQQRLTTIIIALNSIYISDKIKYKHLLSKYLIHEKDGKLRLCPEDDQTYSFLKNNIFDNMAPNPIIKSHYLLLNAKEYFKVWLDKNKEKIEDVLNIIENQLGFLIYTPANDKEIGIMFEVINNRGKALSELEKIKNYFIYYSTVFDRDELRKSINTNWSEVLKYLSFAQVTSIDEENSFLRNCYLVFFSSSKNKSWDVYDELKKKFPIFELSDDDINYNITEIENFILFLERASRYYAYLKKGSFIELFYTQEKVKKQFSTVLKQLRCQSTSASILPLYLSIMDIYQSEPENLIELLTILEKLNFRVYVLLKITNRADSHQSILFEIAYLLFNLNKDKQAKIEWDNYKGFVNQSNNKMSDFEKIKELLISFTTKFCTIHKFVQSLTLDMDEDDNYYKWQGIRYLLANYEHEAKLNANLNWNIENILITREDASKQTNNYLSLEHIWASKNRISKFPEDHIQKRRLGNFVLLGLGLNIQNQDKDIDVKINLMNEKNNNNADSNYSLIQVKELNDYYTKSVEYLKNEQNNSNKTDHYYYRISKKINDLRETDLIRFALKRWSFDGEKIGIFKYVDSFEAEKDKKNENYFLISDNTHNQI